MTRLANHDAAGRELSTDTLETIAAGVQLMSGAPNSINGTERVQNGSPPPPRIWMGGAAHAVNLHAF